MRNLLWNELQINYESNDRFGFCESKSNGSAQASNNSDEKIMSSAHYLITSPAIFFSLVRKRKKRMTMTMTMLAVVIEKEGHASV